VSVYRRLRELEFHVEMLLRPIGITPGGAFFDAAAYTSRGSVDSGNVCFRGERVAELAGCALQQLRRSAGLTLGPLKINVMLAIGTQQGCESWIRDLKYGGRFFAGQLM